MAIIALVMKEFYDFGFGIFDFGFCLNHDLLDCRIDLILSRKEGIL